MAGVTGPRHRTWRRALALRSILSWVAKLSISGMALKEGGEPLFERGFLFVMVMHALESSQSAGRGRMRDPVLCCMHVRLSLFSPVEVVSSHTGRNKN